MFTGIVEAMGEVVALEKKKNLFTLSVRKPKGFTDLRIGDSVANDGACLTVTSLKDGLLHFALVI